MFLIVQHLFTPRVTAEPSQDLLPRTGDFTHILLHNRDQITITFHL